MDQNEFIKSLSFNDKKTLSQKCLKLVEEVGELAKVVLPFDSAHGTSHRFVDKEKILEEIADVHLTNFSIAYSLGFSDEDINNMILKKSIKWSSLQSNEGKVDFPLPYEIHITISKETPKFLDRNHNLSYLLSSFERKIIGNNKSVKYTEIDYDNSIEDIFIEEFKKTCQRINVKPIIIDLEVNDNIVKDVMTSSKHIGDNRSVYEESQRIVTKLKESGFNVLRTKIETVPWHPAAPTSNGVIDNGCYFESHIGVIISKEEKERLNILVNTTLKDKEIIELSGKSKLSQNFFKKSNSGDKYINMLTYRSVKVGRVDFENEVNKLKDFLNKNGFEFEKVELEYCLYDTNILHDSLWINS